VPVIPAREMGVQGKCVIVTGAFGVLGRAVAGLLAERGARVAAVDLAPAAPSELIGLLGEGAAMLGGVDLADPEAAARAAAAAVAAFGGLDGLINVAGG